MDLKYLKIYVFIKIFKEDLICSDLQHILKILSRDENSWYDLSTQHKHEMKLADLGNK